METNRVPCDVATEVFVHNFQTLRLRIRFSNRCSKYSTYPQICGPTIKLFSLLEILNVSSKTVFFLSLYVRLIQSSPYAWLSNWNASVKFLPSLQQNFTHTHTRCSSSSFIVTLSLIRRTACARTQFGGCSSATNGHSETRLMAVCCQNLPLGAFSSLSALPVTVGALFKKFGLFFLNTPCTSF